MKSLMVVLASFVFIGGCAGVDPGSGARVDQTDSSAPVVSALRAAGLEVRDAGIVEQPFFSVPAHVYVVEESDLQLYAFPTAADAERAAAQVAPSGSPIGTSSVSWMAPPHFFRKDNLIVNYIGTSERVLSELRRLLGPQFAGR